MTRTAYYGVVPFLWKGARVYAVPSWLDEKKLASGELEGTVVIEDTVIYFQNVEKAIVN